jgi:two-component system, chemotaxis family, CheB/CheR fusion protein
MQKKQDGAQSHHPAELNRETPQQAASFPIIGMGGASGSLPAYQKFFTHMPANAGMAFVIIVHQDKAEGLDYSVLLKESTSIPVLTAKDGMKVCENHIYVIPPSVDMGIHNGHLLLFSASRPKGAHMPIDYFFQSLAEDQWNKAVAIIFSGLGADGETGLRMIKEKLGMAMVQEPDTAEFSSMPSAAIKTHMADYVLPPEEMPLKLIQYLNHPVLVGEANEELASPLTNKVHIQKILMLLRSQTGHDFTLYKKNTISRRIERRIAFHQLPDYESYVNYLRENPAEIDILFNELLIGVTKFFRDRHAFDSLKEHVYRLLEQKSPEEPIRIWIAGCSTGEEAYSIAIIITEFLDNLKSKRKPKAQIFATDLDPNAIDHARAGFYFSNIVAELSAQQLERFFVKKPNGYTVKKEIREMIVFAQHNLIKDAPFTRLDLLCCRNVMIYLTTELQKKIIPVFHYSLQPNGLLFLGPAESVGAFNDIFNSIDSKWKIFERKEGVSAIGKILDFPFHIANQDKLGKIDSAAKAVVKNPIAENFNKVLLENYTPASLLLNDKGEILYINGKTNRFIQLNPGEAVMNIHRMVREELKYVLGNAIHLCLTNRTKVEINDIRIKENNRTYLMGFSVDYLNEPALQGLLLVNFYEKGLVRKSVARKSKSASNISEGAVEELEKELTYTKQQLHTTIEQMETSLEELKSTNEELQSTNEELQSTNEEALTTKEEMQSLNEELMTINLQYQNKAEELTQLNNDMKNLLDNTEIGTIFLDNQLNILRFTPQVTRLFNVITSDIGRSITHIVSNFEYPSIEQTINEVITTLSGKELEIKTKKGEWYNLRIMPYRTMDNFINGAVLTFTKITPIKSMNARMLGLLQYAQSTADLHPQATVVLDADRKVLVCNEKFQNMFRIQEYEIRELSFTEIVINKWQMDLLSDKLSDSSLTSEEIYVQHHFNGLGMKYLEIKIERIMEKGTGSTLIMILSFKEK